MSETKSSAADTLPQFPRVRAARRVVATILIDRVTHAVSNSYSAGPGCVPHSYDLVGGGHVYEIAGVWKLERHGSSRVVRVEIERYKDRPEVRS